MYCTACSTVFSVEYSVQSSTNLAVTETHEDWRLRTQISVATKHKNLFLPLFTHLNPVMPFQFYFTYKISGKRAQSNKRKKADSQHTVYVQSQQFTQALTILHKHACGARDILHVSAKESSSDAILLWLNCESASLHIPIIFNIPFIFVICS